MYMILPGCRTFKEELTMILACFKQQVGSFIYKLYEIDRIYSC